LLTAEKNYDFRKRMLEIHEKNIRNYDIKPESDCFDICDNVGFYIDENADDIVLTAARDFVDYMFTSQNVSLALKKGKAKLPCINLRLASDAGFDLKDAAGYRGFCIEINQDGVFVYGNDSRGIAQGVYYLEDIMTMKKAPHLKFGTTYLKSVFSPQMVHSGYALDEYPNEHLSAIAHEGRDAILVFAEGANKSPRGYVDFNELIYRASKYGLDVYAYSYIKSEMHPDDLGADEYYESTYGELFKKCPCLKGVFLVGESVSFPSKDPHTYFGSRDLKKGEIPTDKPDPGWYPCCDYPEWISMVKKHVCKYNPSADIIFCSYNWSINPEEERVKLINALPKDITLLAMFNVNYEFEIAGAKYTSHDYSISRPGYSAYFESEARAAKKNGIKLYSMTNSGGLTWDFGVVPYLPFPHQWLKRYRLMLEAHDKWNLSGIMECHHYGLYPSFISKLSKFAYFEPRMNMDMVLENILKSEFGSACYDIVNNALSLWSDAINYYIPINADQYGAFRVGPSYPFCYIKEIKIPDLPHCLWGSRICLPNYIDQDDGTHIVPLSSISLPNEIASLEKLKKGLHDGLETLKSVDNPNNKLLMLINLGEFLYRSTITGINAKRWCILKNKTKSETDKKKMALLFDEMKELLLYERENAKLTIPLVQNDSRLGWEPSMEYMTDEEHLLWKIKQVDYVLNVELKNSKDNLDVS